VQEYVRAGLCQWGDSQSDRKTTNEFKYLFLLLSIAAEIDYATLLNVCQWSVNDVQFCVLGHQAADRLQNSIQEILAACIGKIDYNTLPAPS